MEARVSGRAGSQGTPSRLPSRTRALVGGLVVAAAGALLTLGVAANVRDAAHEAAQERFDESSDQSARAIEREIEGYFDELNGAGAFLAATSDPPADAFDRYVRGSGIFDRLPSLTGVVYLQIVQPDEYEAFAADRAASHPEYTRFEIGTRPPDRPHLVLTYYVPGALNLAFPVGAEVSPILSISDLVAAAGPEGTGVAGSFQDDPLLRQIAEDTDFPAIEEFLSLDFFIGVPVYGGDPDDVEIGVDEPDGWIAAPVAKFDEVLAAAAEDLPTNLGMSLTVDLDGMDAQAEEEALSRVAQLPGDAGPRADAARSVVTEHEINGVQWTLELWSGERPSTWTATLALAGGLLASALAGLLAYARIRSRDRDRAFAAELAEREAFRRAVLDSVVEPMVVLDRDGLVLSANPAWWSLRGVEAPTDDGPDVGRPYLEVLRGQARGGLDELRAGFGQVGGGVQHAEVDVPIDAGAVRRWFAVRITPMQGETGGAVVVHNDITERKRSEAELEMKASHDDLTGLLNRSAIEQEVERVLQRARAHGGLVGVLFIDLDGFKAINDTHGHGVGDDVLRAVARRITGAVRTDDRVARLGGDEFVVLITSLQDPGDAEVTSRRILDALHEPVSVGSLRLPIGASIGVAVVDSPLAGSSQSLIELADQAMYTSKQAGGGRYSVS